MFENIKNTATVFGHFVHNWLGTEVVFIGAIIYIFIKANENPTSTFWEKLKKYSVIGFVFLNLYVAYDCYSAVGTEKQQQTNRLPGL